MNKIDMLRYCGSMEQVAGIRPVEYTDGRAAGLRMLQVHSGFLEFGLQQDKCLDPAYVRYKGINLTPLSAPGLQGQIPYDTHGSEALRSLMIGAMFTSGFENIHGTRLIDGNEYPMHGRIRSTPMEKLSMDAAFRGDSYVVEASGEAREACLFGENMVLRRKVSTEYDSTEIHITDIIENQSFHPEKLCFLYHCNGGFPFLQEGCRFIIPHTSVTPMNDNARRAMDKRMEVSAPQDNAPENVYLYEPAADKEGNTFAAIVNDRLEIALCVKWNIQEIPLLTQWKSMASGNYMVALEPTNSGFDSREERNLEILNPRQIHVNHFTMAVVDGREAIAQLDCRREALECNQ